MLWRGKRFGDLHVKKRMVTRFIVLSARPRFSCLACLLAGILTALSTTARGQSSIPTTAQRLVAAFRLAEKDVGYVLFDLADGHALEAHDPHEPKIPASTTKVVATVAALQILGADHRFTTTLLTAGEVHNGALKGDLYIRGGGDPTLTTTDLRKFAEALSRAGITRITGKFIFDESLSPTTSAINLQQPLAVSYNPGLSALSVNFNRIILRWRHNPGAAAFSTSVLSPADGGPVAIKAITTGSLPAGLDRRIKFLPDGAGMDRWLLSPFLPARGQEELPVKTNPGRLTALLLSVLSRQRGVALPSPQAGDTPDYARPLYVHYSAPLPEIISKVLRYSNNLAAELIGQAAARRLHGGPLTLYDSATVVKNWCQQPLPHVDWDGFHSMNHSGLSGATRHTPRQLAEILRYAWVNPPDGARFSDLLSPPHWGKEEEPLRQRVKAKSGTMSYADGLIGYLTTKRERDLGFVILVTDFLKRAELDATFDVRIADSPPQAHEWTARVKAFEQALIADWVQRY